MFGVCRNGEFRAIFVWEHGRGKQVNCWTGSNTVFYIIRFVCIFPD